MIYPNEHYKMSTTKRKRTVDQQNQTCPNKRQYFIGSPYMQGADDLIKILLIFIF